MGVFFVFVVTTCVSYSFRDGGGDGRLGMPFVFVSVDLVCFGSKFIVKFVAVP